VRRGSLVSIDEAKARLIEEQKRKEKEFEKKVTSQQLAI
jgi:hypothetical protein